MLSAGFMTTHELKKFESLHSDFNKYWMPLTWFSNLAAAAREEGRVRDDVALRLLMDVSLGVFFRAFHATMSEDVFNYKGRMSTRHHRS